MVVAWADEILFGAVGPGQIADPRLIGRNQARPGFTALIIIFKRDEKTMKLWCYRIGG